MFILRFLTVFSLAAWIFQGMLPAETINGTILIKKRLTRPNVTATVSIYQRGPAVDPGIKTENDPLAWERSRVVIYLEGPGPAEPVSLSMEQVSRQFFPDLLVVPVGSTVTFPNGDPIFHNVFSLSKSRSFDLGNYPKGASRSVQFTKSGIVYVNCHLHANMTGAIVVTPNRWYTKADREGRFTLSDVPPGEYTVVAWHKTAGYFRKKLKVGAGSDSVVDFFIPFAADEPGISLAGK